MFHVTIFDCVYMFCNESLAKKERWSAGFEVRMGNTLNASDGINSEDSLLVHPVVSSGLHESFIISCVLYDDIWFHVKKACNRSLLLCHKQIATNWQQITSYFLVLAGGKCTWWAPMFTAFPQVFNPEAQA